MGLVIGVLSLVVMFPLACDHSGMKSGLAADAGSGGSALVDSGGQGGASANDDAASETGGALDGATDPVEDQSGSSTIGFSCTLDCAGSLLVYLGVRPPQTAGSDVISWNAVTMSGEPTADQLWTYDVTNRLLVNSINSLALKVRPDKSLTLGASSTDGNPLTFHSNVDGTYGLVFDDGNVVGIAAANCQGAPFASVAPGTAGYRTAYIRH